MKEILPIKEDYSSLDGGFIAHSAKNNPAGALRQVQRGANLHFSYVNLRIFCEFLQAENWGHTTDLSTTLDLESTYSDFAALV